MSIKKGFLIVLATAAILMAVGGSSALAHITELTAVSAVAEPYLGEEIVISEWDWKNKKHLPAVAYNPLHDEYLVVWQNDWGGFRDIYARRVNGQGEILSWFAVGPTAPLHPYPNDRVQPSVAYDYIRDRYLVVWAYDKNGDGSDWNIHGTFVNWNGPILGLHEIHICDWTTQQWVPKVVFSPVEEQFMIVWNNEYQAGFPPMYISGRRMNAADGSFPNTNSDFTISHLTDDRVNPEIAYNQWRNQYLVVYDDTQDIFGTRFQGNTLPAGIEFKITAWTGSETRPSVDYDWLNDQYLVAWQNPQPDIYARFVAGDGSLDNIVLHMDFTPVDEINPKVAYSDSGGNFLVTWQQQYSSTTGPYGVHGQFVNTDKTLGAFFGIVAPTSGVAAEFTSPVVAGGSGNFLTVWEHDRAGTVFQDIHGRLITQYALYLPLTLGD